MNEYIFSEEFNFTPKYMNSESPSKEESKIRIVYLLLERLNQKRLMADIDGVCI